MSDRSSGPPPATPILPPPEHAEQLNGLYPVAFLGEFEGPGVWPFPLDRSRVVLGGAPIGTDSIGNGSACCDISIPGRSLSATHVMLERRATSVRVYDLHSTNGTYVGNTKVETSWDVRIGDKFSPWPLTLFLMDTTMYEHRPMLAEILGQSFRPSPDMVLTEVVRQACHVIIAAADGCGQERLARAIHKMSPRHTQDLVEVSDIPTDRAAQSELIRRASKAKTTVVLRVTPPMDAEFLRKLYDPSYGIRVIALAKTDEDADLLPRDAALRSYRIALRPLAYREAEIAQLLDQMFASGGAPHLRAGDLLDENQEALRRYDWPSNLAQLHEVADAIVALDAYRGLRSASRAMGIPSSTLHDTLSRAGLKMRRVGDSSAEGWSVFRSDVRLAMRDAQG
jgi:hypothetical protein